MVIFLGHAGLVTWQQMARPQVLVCFVASLAGVEGDEEEDAAKKEGEGGRGDMAGGGNWRED